MLDIVNCGGGGTKYGSQSLCSCEYDVDGMSYASSLDTTKINHGDAPSFAYSFGAGNFYQGIFIGAGWINYKP
jgi:hypothetical protein